MILQNEQYSRNWKHRTVFFVGRNSDAKSEFLLHGSDFFLVWLITTYHGKFCLVGNDLPFWLFGDCNPPWKIGDFLEQNLPHKLQNPSLLYTFRIFFTSRSPHTCFPPLVPLLHALCLFRDRQLIFKLEMLRLPQQLKRHFQCAADSELDPPTRPVALLTIPPRQWILYWKFIVSRPSYLPIFHAIVRLQILCLPWKSETPRSPNLVPVTKHIPIPQS